MYIVRASRWRYVAHLAGSVAVVAAGILFLQQRGSSWLAWTLIVLFGVTGFAALTMLLENRTRFILDHDGVWDFNWRVGTVRWVQIKDVFVRRIGNQEFICFTVFDREGLQAQRDVVKRGLNETTNSLGFGDLVVDATKLRLPTYEVVEFAAKRIAESR